VCNIELPVIAIHFSRPSFSNRSGWLAVCDAEDPASAEKLVTDFVGRATKFEMPLKYISTREPILHEFREARPLFSGLQLAFDPPVAFIGLKGDRSTLRRPREYLGTAALSVFECHDRILAGEL
jgi:hypothetical protein